MTKKLILVDKDDNPIGECEKLEAHKKGLLHRAFSLFVCNDNGEILLQQRAKAKYHSGGIWSNTVCSHPAPGKNIEKEVQKRSQEEMGFACETVKEIFPLYYKSEYENELCENEITHIFFGKHNSNPFPNPEEVMNYKWETLENIQKNIRKNPENFTTWFRIILQNKIFLKKAKEFCDQKKENKLVLRKYFITLRQNITPEDKKILSIDILKQLSEIIAQEKNSSYVAIFSATKQEVHILDLIKKFPEKKFCLPKIDKTEEGKMDFFEVSTLNNLQKGAFGILEPKDFCKKINPSDIKIFCIPAVAIDTRGVRLGMGGGFYDQYLSKVSPQTQKIGVIFSCQISEKNLPKEDFDIGVDMIVSEKKLVQVSPL